MIKRTVKFDLNEAQIASDEWRFNCGPGALCAVLDMTPVGIRPHMLDFESKGYTNPTLMFNILDGLNVTHRQVYRSDNPSAHPIIKFGLMRVQFGGPWTKAGVPMRVRYRHTHWVAIADDSEQVFDINAMCAGGWMSSAEWAGHLMPWLAKECCPKGDGTFWPTHAIELERKVGG